MLLRFFHASLEIHYNPKQGVHDRGWQIKNNTTVSLSFQKVFANLGCWLVLLLILASKVFIKLTELRPLWNIQLSIWNPLKLWQNKNSQMFVVMLSFCMSSFSACSWCKFKKRRAKTKHHHKRLSLFYVNNLK